MKFLENIPSYLFFTGKGGVGKTSISCATAIRLAELGKRVLLVSTDPASNVGQVFDQTIGNTIQPVTAVSGLSALEIDPQDAAQQYRARIVDPIKGLLPDDVVNSISEQLSGACTTEIAAFDEFTGLLTDASLLTRFDHIIFDTAPTGHTIRLLQLPEPGAASSKVTRMVLPVLVQWLGWKNNASNMLMRLRHYPILNELALCWSRDCKNQHCRKSLVLMTNYQLLALKISI
jgi:arsenite-transporting ATPase